MMAPLSLKSFSCIYFIRTSAYRQMKRPKHREEQMILRMWILRMWSRKHTARRRKLSARTPKQPRQPKPPRRPTQPRKLKQPMVGSRFYFSEGKFLCINATNDDRMMAPLYFGTVKVIFLHVLHPDICLQAEENAQPERKVDEREEQKRAAEEAETANTRMQVRLSVWKILVH